MVAVMGHVLREIRPNPFRQVDRYPIDQAKLEALRESIRSTGFWDNLLARDNGGGPELAYGHHRLRALIEEYGPDHEVELTIRDLDDEQMLKIMARENMEEWAANVTVEYETVRAVVAAYGTGQINLRPPGGHGANKSAFRYAPGFGSVGNVSDGSRPYTAQTVAEFIGWLDSDGKPSKKAYDAIGALELIEAGVLAESRFVGLTAMQARALITETRKAKLAADAEAERKHKQAEEERIKAEEARRRGAEKEAKLAERRQKTAEAEAQQRRQEGRQQAERVGEGLSRGMRSGEYGWRDAGVKARGITGAKAKTDGPPPHIDQFTEKLVAQLAKALTKGDKQTEKLEQLVKYREHISRRQRRDLGATLTKLGRRADKYADRITRELGTGGSRRLSRQITEQSGEDRHGS